MNPETATAISVVAAAAISGGLLWNTQREGLKVTKMRSLLEAYDAIVQNLQTEVERLGKDLDNVRQAMDECESRNAEVEKRVAELTIEVAACSEKHSASGQRNKPGPKPGTKRAAPKKKA